MTIPWMMNCSHMDNGWCIACVSELGERYAALRDARGEADQRWRDTKVTVPCDGDNVLAYWCAVVGNGETAWCVAHYYTGRWHNPDDDEDDYRAPDFWMPLPAAPGRSEQQPTKEKP